ncbi:DUF1553 domain-containing protein [bacterium]|nr:DUF1553 domain-containing protein [bacterium]
MASLRLILKSVVYIVVLAFGMVPAAGQDQGPVLAGKAESLIVARCIRCHAGDEAKGGLDLSTRIAALKGGKNGPSFAPANSEDSLMWQRVADDEMPPKSPLPDDEKRILAAWIDSGAAWPDQPIDPFRRSTARSAGYDWWSFRPVRSVFPEIADTKTPGANPVDTFVDRELARNDLKPNPRSRPRDLIRRLSFDLTGLPPSPELVRAFEADPSQAHYLRIVDTMLASPRFGERWARHWLDVVRYGESTGFERNEPNFTIWPYRDWVIKAINDDMPFDRFARMQIAGDLENPGQEGAAASAFLVAGVHNTVIGVSRRMRLLARQDELEETIGTLGQAFLGLTVQCARCHDHKFDPISSREYYGMIAAIDGVQHGERVFENLDAQVRRADLESRFESVSARIAALEARARASAPVAESRRPEPKRKDLPVPYAMWSFDNGPEDEAGNLHGQLVGGARIESGALVLDGVSAWFRTPTLKKYLGIKTFEAWVMTDDLDQRGGGVISLQSNDGGIFDAIVFGEQETRRWMAGSDGFSRTASFRGQEETEAKTRPVHVAIVWDKDGVVSAYRDGMPYGTPYKTVPAKFPLNDTHLAIGLRHLPAGGNRMFRGRVLRAAVYDRALKPAEIERSAARESGFVSPEELAARLGPEAARQHGELRRQRQGLAEELARVVAAPKPKIYAVQANAQPEKMRVHVRGDINEFGPEVAPAGLKALGASSDWGLTPDAPDRDRRTRLAAWITSKDNPAFPRVIVNRLWHHHFGTGIVETPNDFGFNGGRPSHPELLDFLARKLIDEGYRLKPIHRLIVTSEAYMRSSDPNPVNSATDAAGRFLWRHAPSRLEGEAIRDAMLAISGTANPAMGGPGFVDVSVTPNNGTTYYEPIDSDDQELQRRTVYRFSPRGGRSTLLDTFDCPDSATTSPRRNVTTTPLQALSLLHGDFTVRMARETARRIEAERLPGVEEQLARAWSLILQRSPDSVEAEMSRKLLERHGLWAVCLGLFNANEFVVVP